MSNPHECFKNDILIVDDENLIRKSLKSLLASISLKADEAADGHEAITMITERFECQNCSKYKIVIMDLMMPNMDGFEACSELEYFFKKYEILDIYLPNIIISSAHDEDSIRQSLKKNTLVKSFIPKPVNKTKIQNTFTSYYYK